MRKGDLLDVRTADACIHAIVVSARSHRISVRDMSGKQYSFPKHYTPKVVRPFGGTLEERRALIQSIRVR